MARTKQTARAPFRGLHGKRKLDASNDANTEPPTKRQKMNDDSDPNSNSNSPLSTKQVVHRLTRLFSSIEQPRNLTYGSRSDVLPLIPGLHINDIGHVPLPISDAQVKLLLSSENTANAQAIHPPFAFNAEQFHFKNPKWNKRIQKLMHSVSVELGCDRKTVQYVKVRRDKLLIYDKDTDVAQTTDTDELDGVFAKIVIQLPSDYAINDNNPVLMVKHGDISQAFYFGRSDSQYNIYLAAFLSSGLQEETRNVIQNGTRIVVTYHLCWNGPRHLMPAIANIDTITNDVDKILTLWKSDTQHPIAICLENTPLEGVDSFKGVDYPKIHSLMRSQTAKEMNLRVFIAEIRRTIQEGDSSYALLESCKRGNSPDYDELCDWEEHGRNDAIQPDWIGEDGTEFKFGKYVDLDLDNHCIGYDQKNDYDWEEIERTQEGYKHASQTTIYSKHIAVIFRENKQFDMFLNGKHGIEAAIEFTKYLSKQDTDHDISNEIKAIMRKFDAKHDGTHIVPILSVLKGQNMWASIAEFVDVNNIGLYHQRNSADTYTRNRSYRRSSSDASSNKQKQKSMVRMVEDIVNEYGWKEPIKGCVLKLIESMNHSKCQTSHIMIYCSFLKSMRASKIGINSDDAQAMADKIWTNIARKLGLDTDDPSAMNRLSAETVFCIFQFILSYNWNEQKQREMWSVFIHAYGKYVETYTKASVMKQWIQYLEGHHDQIVFQMKTLIQTFDVKQDCAHIVPILSVLKGQNMWASIAEFIDVNNIGLYDPKNSGETYTKRNRYVGSYGSYRRSSANASNKQKQKSMVRMVEDIVNESGWKEPIKGCVLKLIESMNHSKCQASDIKIYCSFLKSMRKASNIGMNSDDVQTMADKIWTNVARKLCLDNDDASVMNRLGAETIFCIFQFILSYNWNEQKQRDMSSAFINAYSKKVETSTKEYVMKQWIQYLEGHHDQIIFQMKTLIQTCVSKHTSKHCGSLLSLIMTTNMSHNTPLMLMCIEKLVSLGIYLINAVIDIIICYGWGEPIKSCVLLWLLQGIENISFNDKRFTQYFRLPKLLKDKMNSKNMDQSEDDDTAMLGNDKENILRNMEAMINGNGCWKKLMEHIWEMVMNKMDLKGNSNKLCAMNPNCMISILRFMIFCSDEWSKEYAVEMFKLFENKYVQIGHDIKQKIILKLKEPEFTWKMLEKGHVSDAQFEAFLKGNQSTFTKRGFTSIVQARKWYNSYAKSSCGDRYSVEISQAHGRGSNAYVKVTKTKKYWKNKINQQYNTKMNDLNTILSLLNYKQ
eukprot:257952_1